MVRSDLLARDFNVAFMAGSREMLSIVVEVPSLGKVWCGVGHLESGPFASRQRIQSMKVAMKALHENTKEERGVRLGLLGMDTNLASQQYENDVYRAMQDVVPPIDLKKLDVFEQLGRPKEASVTGVN